MTASSGRPEVTVLCEGYLVREGSVVVDASSTVALIVADGGVIVVDTGAPSEVETLRESLANAGFEESEVDVVVNTHLHTDHCGGNDMFANAVKMAHRLERPPIRMVKVEDGDELAAGVNVRCTPGHTAGSLSVLVESGDRCAICGDAIPTRQNFESGTPPAIHMDRGLAIQSMKSLVAWADVVIPGHGAAFDTLGKK